MVVFTHVITDDVDDWDRWFLGRAPRTRETLPDFLESCRVARHSRVFRGLTGSQQTPGEWGFTRPAHEVGTFPSRADDLHIGGILQVVYSRDHPTTWSTNIHSVG